MDIVTDTGPGVREWPFATREECWRALRPGAPFSASGFQRMASKGLVTDGVRVSARRDGHAIGQGRFFSRLNLLALAAHRAGAHEDWARLRSLAASIESDARLVELADEVLRGHGAGPAPHMSELSAQVRGLVMAVGDLTDHWQRTLPGEHSRFPALVGRVHGGVADLVLAVGGTCTFSEAKLAGIGRGRVGDAVYVHLIDLGGPDELVRARPAVRASVPDTPRPIASPGDPPGPFDRHVTDVTGEPVEALGRLVGSVERTALPDLSGLRWSRDR